MIDYCRLCLNSNELTTNIITADTYYSSLTISEFIYWIFDVEVDVNDTYSKCICLRCMHLIKNIAYYRDSFKKNQLELKNKGNEVVNIHNNRVDDWIFHDILRDKSKKKSLPKDSIPNSLLPVVSITRLENCVTLKNYDKISDLIYKERRKEHKNPNQNDKENNGSVENLAKFVDETVKVPTEIFQYCLCPSLSIPKVEDKEIFEGYQKISDTTYQEVPYKLDLECNFKRSEKRRLKFVDYYYQLPTTALQQLIKEKQVSHTSSDIFRATPKEIELVNINDVHEVSVCKYCSQTFEKRHMLMAHYKMDHKKPQIAKLKLETRKGRKKKQKYKQSKLLLQGVTRHQRGYKRCANNQPEVNPLVREILNTDYDLSPNKLVLEINNKWSVIKGLICTKKKESIVKANDDSFQNLRFVTGQDRNSILQKEDANDESINENVKQGENGSFKSLQSKKIPYISPITSLQKLVTDINIRYINEMEGNSNEYGPDNFITNNSYEQRKADAGNKEHVCQNVKQNENSDITSKNKKNGCVTPTLSPERLRIVMNNISHIHNPHNIGKKVDCIKQNVMQRNSEENEPHKSIPKIKKTVHATRQVSSNILQKVVNKKLENRNVNKKENSTIATTKKINILTNINFKINDVTNKIQCNGQGSEIHEKLGEIRHDNSITQSKNDKLEEIVNSTSIEQGRIDDTTFRQENHINVVTDQNNPREKLSEGNNSTDSPQSDSVSVKNTLRSIQIRKKLINNIRQGNNEIISNAEISKIKDNITRKLDSSEKYARRCETEEDVENKSESNQINENPKALGDTNEVKQYPTQSLAQNLLNLVKKNGFVWRSRRNTQLNISTVKLMNKRGTINNMQKIHRNNNCELSNIPDTHSNSTSLLNLDKETILCDTNEIVAVNNSPGNNPEPTTILSNPHNHISDERVIDIESSVKDVPMNKSESLTLLNERKQSILKNVTEKKIVVSKSLRDIRTMNSEPTTSSEPHEQTRSAKDKVSSKRQSTKIKMCMKKCKPLSYYVKKAKSDVNKRGKKSAEHAPTNKSQPATTSSKTREQVEAEKDDVRNCQAKRLRKNQKEPRCIKRKKTSEKFDYSDHNMYTLPRKSVGISSTDKSVWILSSLMEHIIIDDSKASSDSENENKRSRSLSLGNLFMRAAETIKQKCKSESHLTEPVSFDKQLTNDPTTVGPKCTKL